MKAFPSENDADKHYHWIEKGMDLRDYFAAKAMQGLLSNVDYVKLTEIFAVNTHVKPTEILSKESYFIADAMMKAREK